MFNMNSIRKYFHLFCFTCAKYWCYITFIYIVMIFVSLWSSSFFSNILLIFRNNFFKNFSKLLYDIFCSFSIVFSFSLQVEDVTGFVTSLLHHITIFTFLTVVLLFSWIKIKLYTLLNEVLLFPVKFIYLISFSMIYFGLVRNTFMTFEACVLLQIILKTIKKNY